MNLGQLEIFHAIMKTGSVTAATAALAVHHRAFGRAQAQGRHGRASIHADVVKVARSKDFTDILQPQGLEPDFANPVEFRVFLAAEPVKWSTLVKDSGARLDREVW